MNTYMHVLVTTNTTDSQLNKGTLSICSPAGKWFDLPVSYEDGMRMATWLSQQFGAPTQEYLNEYNDNIHYTEIYGYLE